MIETDKLANIRSYYVHKCKDDGSFPLFFWMRLDEQE